MEVSFNITDKKFNLFLLYVSVSYVFWSACVWSYGKDLQFIIAYNSNLYHVHHSYWGLVLLLTSILLSFTRIKRYKFFLIGMGVVGMVLIINHFVTEGFIISPTIF